MFIAVSVDFAEGDHNRRPAIATFKPLADKCPSGWAARQIDIPVDATTPARAIELEAVRQKVAEGFDNNGLV
jgi:hypothetical protein